MKNSNPHDEYLDNEIDLIEILRTLYSSKKLIILITLASALLAFIYSTQEEVTYQSSVILEVGSYDLLDDEELVQINAIIDGEKTTLNNEIDLLVDPVSSLIKKLKINQISKQLDVLNFKSIEEHFLEINYTSPSPEFNEKLINKAIKFSQESSMKILKSQLENQKITIENNLKALESKNNFLLQLIPEEENNIIKWQFYVQTLDLQNSMINFNQEKDALELRIKFATDQKNINQIVRELETNEIKPKQLLITLLGTIFGFIFSIFIVFIRLIFLKEQN